MVVAGLAVRGCCLPHCFRDTKGGRVSLNPQSRKPSSFRIAESEWVRKARAVRGWQEYVPSMSVTGNASV